MSGEGVIDESNAPGLRIIRDLPGYSDAPDSACIDLNEAKTSIVDHVSGLVKIVAALTARKSHRVADTGQVTISRQCAGSERLFQPKSAGGLEGRQAQRGLSGIIVPNCARIDEQ